MSMTEQGVMAEPRPVLVADFKLAVDAAKSEMEIRRLILVSLIGLAGTEKEIAEALAFADRRANLLR